MRMKMMLQAVQIHYLLLVESICFPSHRSITAGSIYLTDRSHNIASTRPGGLLQLDLVPASFF